jgi:F-type H+-transporting ATPase subunit b
LRNPLQRIRISAIFLFAVFAAALALAPLRVAAQAPSAAPANSTAAGAITPSSTVTPASKSEEEQEQDLLHAPVVQSLARMLHLNLNTTIFLLLGINFAIIVLSIPYALFRWLPSLWPPNVLRKRRERLRLDLETARAATADAQSRLSAVEAKLAGLGEEMEKFRAQVEQDSLEDEKRIKAALSEESSRIVAVAEQEISVAAAQIRRGLRDFAADLAIDQASRQLALTPETDRALIAEFVASVAADVPGKGGRN